MDGGMNAKHVIVTLLLFSIYGCEPCPAMDWVALHEVEGSPAANEVGCSGDLGWEQISPPVWAAYANPGERWWVKSDNLAVAKRIMDDRFHKLASHRSDFDDALLWFCPGRRNNPSAVAIDYATRYQTIVQSHRK
jgi:hypothetical protein